jgi:uncharacterized membrane protein YhhN
MNRDTTLALGTALAAALAILSAPWGLAAPWMNIVFKPLATLGVIAYAWPRGRDMPALRRWLLAGLVLSLVGDVALLWPQQGFLPGLVSFLLAHLAYLSGFTRVRRLAASPVPFVAYAVAGAILWQLWPGVPVGLQTPVAVYVVALAAMAAQAAVLWRGGAPRGAVLAVGGALFVASDALLATNRFAGPLPLSALWILVTYWSAQWCIASFLSPSSSPGGGR